MNTAVLTARIPRDDMSQLNKLIGSTSLLKTRSDVVKQALRLYLDALNAKQKSPTNKR